ncbi:hypothetical protein [Pedobacter cryotolerans]|uniref:VCBS repeat-containing protein n=1 Tax=Pedobacter cryotolerans TaxID=2571270 RepID=A0A4U1BYL2_9SPHI|nr:hypothetical protein [Pedobacter cryotolerans]TKB96529.1 hypothetical protein FA045_17870 [Pedobacter cryotolerans]
MVSFSEISSRELDFYKIVTGDLDNDGDLDAVLQYSLIPTDDDKGGDGVEHPKLLTGLIVYRNEDSDFEMIEHNKDGYAYYYQLHSIENGIIKLDGKHGAGSLIFKDNQLTAAPPL